MLDQTPVIKWASERMVDRGAHLPVRYHHRRYLRLLDQLMNPEPRMSIYGLCNHAAKFQAHVARDLTHNRLPNLDSAISGNLLVRVI
jgi:hypothetical protein